MLYVRFKKFVRNDLLKISHQRKDMERTRKKWELIEGKLPKMPGSLLDIGCSEGFFTRNAARLGWFAWGIDRLDYVVDYSTKIARKENLNNAYFSTGEMNLQAARCLPEFDVIIMASTFQEICSAFGLEEGYQIFDFILKACKKKIFFETCTTNKKYGDGINIFEKENDLGSVEKWVRSLAKRSPDWDVTFIGKVPYSKKAPFRFMFVFERKIAA